MLLFACKQPDNRKNLGYNAEDVKAKNPGDTAIKTIKIGLSINQRPQNNLLRLHILDLRG